MDIPHLRQIYDQYEDQGIPPPFRKLAPPSIISSCIEVAGSFLFGTLGGLTAVSALKFFEPYFFEQKTLSFMNPTRICYPIEESIDMKISSIFKMGLFIGICTSAFYAILRNHDRKTL